jgi:hypothetical protein
MRGINSLPSLVLAGNASFHLSLAFLFVCCVMVLAINFLLDFLSLPLNATTLANHYG